MIFHSAIESLEFLKNMPVSMRLITTDGSEEVLDNLGYRAIATRAGG